MNTSEFSREFDILYNSIATNAAPNLDKYEKSVYLSKAQLELIKNYFNPKGNKYQEGFENSSKRRVDLKELISQYKSTNKYINNNNISSKSRFFQIPNDVFLIINEKATFGPSLTNVLKVNTGNINTGNFDIIRESVSNDCLVGKEVNVKPKKHDEINSLIKNPFKNPGKDLVWRLDFQQNVGNIKTIELLSEYSVKEYLLRYVKYPKPIILTNLDIEFPNEGLSIDGQVTEQTCELNESIHREILDRAIELAMADYRPEMLQVKTQVNNRNE